MVRLVLVLFLPVYPVIVASLAACRLVDTHAALPALMPDIPQSPMTQAWRPRARVGHVSCPEGPPGAIPA